MISFLHTSPVHVATFDALVDELAPGMVRRHRVEEGWLAQARTGMTAELSATIFGAMNQLAATGVGVCTCSTIGAAAEAADAPHTPIVRIDRALMEIALVHGNRPLIAMCLESTAGPTMELLADVAEQAGVDVHPQQVMCEGAWAHFEAGDMTDYGVAIADAVKAQIDHPDCIVLAQGSMAVAEPLLQQTGLPVLSSPRLGVMKALELLKTR